MDAIDLALAAAFNDPTVGFSVTYRANGGPGGITIRTVKSSPDVSEGFFEVKAKVTALLIDIQAVDVPAPTEQDQVDFDSKTYRVAEFKADTRRKRWHLQLREV